MSHVRTLSRISVQSAPESFNNIKVIARFRPESESEKSHNDAYNMMRFASDDTCQILDAKERQITSQSPSFTFDRVFDTESRQSDVFDFSLRQTVDDLLKGYNGTVLAYGQTGSGKSYTMMGPNMDDHELRGAIPRIVEHIFTSIQRSPGDIEYTVRVSYMEIYMEKIKDLLNVANDNLPIHEDKARGVHVKGLTEHYVTSAGEVFDIMKKGTSVRSVASTNMNSESSRSHSIFALVVTQKNVDTGSQKSGQLFLVDLAGSEKVGKTGASGQTLEEAKKINKSLSALGNVINALTDGKSSHVPYRDSKLTRILQESLGGNSRTSLIVNCSPSSFNDQETISTLRFGVRAKTIKNMAKINAELSPSELRSILRKVHAQLEARAAYDQKLENELLQWRSNNPPDKQDWVEFLRGTPIQPSSPSVSSPRPTSAFGSPPLSGPRRQNRSADTVEEYLQRENELQDSLAQKDNIIDALQQELDTKASSQTIEIDRLMYEKQELNISVSSLEQEIRRLRQQIESVKEDAMQTKLKYEEAISSKLDRMPDGADEAISFESHQNLPVAIQDVMKMAQSKLKILMKSGDPKYLYRERCKISDETVNQLLTEIARLPKENAYQANGSHPDRSQHSPGQIQALQTHISQIESMKQNLMRDLQNRCERIVELEISLDQAREQYDIAFENNHVKQQQRKIAILQRNLEQLTQVQRQVIEQNTSLKKEVVVSQKLLESRNQRIKDLERSLSQSQATLAREQDSYESRLGFLKDKVFEIRNINKVPTNNMGLKIIKPIRGGISEENLKQKA